MAQFVIKKISNKGVSHPVVARLSIQMKDLIEFSGLDSKIKESILKVCMGDLQSRLGKCWDIWERIEKEQSHYNSEYKPSGDRVVQIPQISDLDRDVDNFLYESKNFLRDLANLVLRPCFPEIKFSDAGGFFSPTKKGDAGVILWAESKFGSNDGLTKMLREDIKWISEIIKKRNAIEHPNGYSGTLTVNNISVLEDGRLVAPVWKRTGEEQEFISVGMATACQYLLSFAEEIIIFGCIQKTTQFQMITFAEVPEEERDAKCPIRFRACFMEGAIPKIKD